MGITIVLFIVGLILLIKGGDWFVDGATGIAKKLHIPEILIGATVVSIGTTLPEVMVSATSALSGHGEMAYGNSIGSIICNTSLIAAITITFKPTEIDRASLKFPTIIFFISAVIYVAIAYFFGTFARWCGIILLAIFIVYIVFSILNSKNSPKHDEDDEENIDNKMLLKNIFFLILGAALIAFGADLLVDNGTIIAKEMGVSEAVIALTFIALGTSLPELVTAITSLAKGHGALSLGNIIGANILNLVLVSGVAITFSPFAVPNNTQILGINSSLLIDIPIMLIVMMLLTIPALKSGKLSKIQGILLLIIYISFCAIQFIV